MDNILILIVTYNGAKTIETVLTSCLSDAFLKETSLLVIDNGSVDATVDLVQSFTETNVSILALSENLGVATAYNLGIKEAQKRGLQWLFVLDQDSVCVTDCLSHLYQQAQQLQKQVSKLAGVFPCVRSEQFPDCIHYPYQWTETHFVPAPESVSEEKVLVKVDSSLSSGSLYVVEALADIGGFREDYFIDFVEHECHLRLVQQGWHFYWDRQAVLYHNLGAHQQMMAEGLWIEHAPFRYYYMSRNMLEGLTRLGGQSARQRFLKQDLFEYWKRSFKHGKQPLKSSFFMLRGLLDAFLGRFGRL